MVFSFRPLLEYFLSGFKGTHKFGIDLLRVNGCVDRRSSDECYQIYNYFTLYASLIWLSSKLKLFVRVKRDAC